jgi:hypothetical protein
MFTLDQYSRKASMAIRPAMAVALARHLAGLTFQFGVRFTGVFSEWPSFVKRYRPPCACVLPSSWALGGWMTPTLLEDTWEPQGAQGFGLYKTGESETELEISIATTSQDERAILEQGVEDAFTDPQALMSEQRGPRNAILLPMPEYYGLNARFSYLRGRSIDDDDSAMREKRNVVITVSAQASKVRVGPVYPLALTIQVEVNGGSP